MDNLNYEDLIEMIKNNDNGKSGVLRNIVRNLNRLPVEVLEILEAKCNGFDDGTKWHNLNTDPPKKSGQYLVVIDDNCPDYFCSVEHYFKKGDHITTRISDKETYEERILDTIYNDGLKVIADKDGFYELCDNFNARWNRILNENPYYAVYWSELPPAPLGKTWGRLGSSPEDENG